MNNETAIMADPERAAALVNLRLQFYGLAVVNSLAFAFIGMLILAAVFPLIGLRAAEGSTFAENPTEGFTTLIITAIVFSLFALILDIRHIREYRRI